MATHNHDNDICTNFQHALGYLQRTIEQLREVTPERANKIARVVNEITTIVMDAVVEFDLMGNPQLSSASMVPGRPSPRNCDPYRRSQTPIFPPGLGYDSVEAHSYAAQGYIIVGRGFSYDPPLIPQNGTPTLRQEPLMGFSATYQPAIGLAAPFPSRQLAAQAAIPQWVRFPDVTSAPNFPPLNAPATSELKPVTTAKAEMTSTEVRGPGRSLIPTEPGHPRQSSSSAPIPNHEYSKAARTTWAKIAAIPAPQSKEDRSKTARGSTDTAQVANISERTNLNVDEHIEDQQRVVWISGCSVHTRLRFISEQIHEGPLLSILIDVDPMKPEDSIARAACVIFQNAQDASNFQRENQIMIEQKGCCRYGPGYSIEPGLAWPIDDEILSMSPTKHQRRRLTITGQGLFIRVSRVKFETDVKNIAGKQNVELIWLYNLGNATVVLASVRIARVVREAFIVKARRPGPYNGAVITYSADPCETTLRWTTQMRD